MRSVPSLVASAVVVLGLLTSCGDDDGDGSASAATEGSASSAADGDRPTVVVTTNILGDMVTEVVGDQADVEIIMPLGSDPHDFAASAQQAEAMEQAGLLVVNGAGFEEGLLEVIDSAEQAGAPVFDFSDQIDLLAFTGEHEERSEEAEHAEESNDPHIWTDPARMRTAIGAFAERVAEVEGVDADVIDSQAAAYAEELTMLDAEIEDLLAGVPDERRVLVTNHEVFGYFADRYDFEVLGAVIPSLTTSAAASAAAIEALAEVIREREVPAIFGETTQAAQLAEALASEVGGGVEVVELFTESLGEDGTGADTYVGMMQLNAERISSALT